MIAWLVLLQTTLAIGVAGPPSSPEYLPLRVAEARGYFAGEKLQVSFRQSRAAEGAAEDLGQGRVDLAATTLDAALRLGHTEGKPPRLVFGLTQTPPVAVLVPMIHRDAVQTPTQLVDRLIGIPSPGTPEHGWLRSVLTRSKIATHRVSIRSYGDLGVARALEAGDIAAGVLGDPWATRLLESGRASALVDFRNRDAAARSLGTTTVHAALFARPDSRPAPGELAKLFRALLRAMADLTTAGADELAAGLPPEVVGLPEDFALRVRGAREIFLADGWVGEERLESSVELSRDRSPIPAAVRLPRRLKTLLDTDPLKDVLAARGR
jgi:ABC-type nitrate/sulfonate/bicarbonate transport system substrate-binding protein